MKRAWLALLAVALCMVISGCGEEGSFEAVGQRVYTYEDSNDIIPPSVVLMEHHRFQFTFSAVSSFIGWGTYCIDGDTLVLNTDDEMYQYTFKIVEDEGGYLVFDADNSSETIHFADFKDGAVFK